MTHFYLTITMLFSINLKAANWYLNQSQIDDTHKLYNISNFNCDISKPETIKDPNNIENTLETRIITCWHKSNNGTDKASIGLSCDLKPSKFDIVSFTMHHKTESTNILFMCGLKK